MAIKKKIQPKPEQFWNYKLAIVAVITFIAYYPSMFNGILNWDDIIYVMNNDMIKTLSGDNLAKMFSTFYLGNYHPLVILSFAFDYSLFQMNATGYHVHNLVLHLVNTLLVYAFCYYLFPRKVNLAIIVSLLFAIHPLHVESVAWISERKDLMYTMYFLLSMIAYLFYLNRHDNRFYLLSILLFVMSLLSKAQAVTLPLALFLIDYLLSRKWNLKIILEKVPYLLLSLIFGIVAIYAQDADSSINPNNISVFHSFFYAWYSLWVYLVKLIFPVYQTSLYEYPVTATGTPPWYIFASPLIIPALVIIIFKTWKSKPYVTFGLLFFLLTIFPVLQFLPVGQAIVAERYTYIPYIGLFFIAAILYLQFLENMKKRSLGWMVMYTGFALAAIFAFTTFFRTKVWFDSVSLWTDVLEKNPKSITAYVNRGYMYNQYGEYEKAINDCNAGIKLDSNHFKFYINRGISFRKTRQYDLALADYSKAIEKNPQSYETYLDRGILFTDQFNMYEQGIADFRVYLTFRPEDVNGNHNMSVAYYKYRNYDSAMVYCDKAIALAPDVAGPYYIKALISEAKGAFEDAFANGSKARQLGFSLDDATLLRWQQNAGIPKVTMGKP